MTKFKINGLKPASFEADLCGLIASGCSHTAGGTTQYERVPCLSSTPTGGAL